MATEKPKCARFIVRLPNSLYEKIKKEASDDGVSMNTLCVMKLSQPKERKANRKVDG